MEIVLNVYMKFPKIKTDFVSTARSSTVSEKKGMDHLLSDTKQRATNPAMDRAVDVKNEFCLFILTHKGPRRGVILHEER
ncbi:hypothetical protein PRIPAC_83758 [Pristionchus pacificus]|uniref:Uncharacterized protein n=1 Tax=Pristionchus pacificus TaxID=54126 RepID=A0A2A6BNR7_PRIPA|nr:hypothetical protein PRIPAC_83758 [Pristionchus pacificus]|eukprot:PDM67466.1 hypothetical protein PRIPAC_48883 [Pristionchus pacificus]